MSERETDFLSGITVSATTFRQTGGRSSRETRLRVYTDAATQNLVLWLRRTNDGAEQFITVPYDQIVRLITALRIEAQALKLKG